MAKHVIIDWANLCHNKEEWKNIQWKTKEDFDLIKDIKDQIKQKIYSLINDKNLSFRFYIIFPYGGITLPDFAKKYGNISIPTTVMEDTEVYWPGGFNINERSDSTKKKEFKKKCYISKNNNPLHSCSSPDDLFILWKASEINDTKNTYLVTDDRFGSEKKFIKICHKNKVISLNDLVSLCGNYEAQPAYLEEDKSYFTWNNINETIKGKEVPFTKTFHEILSNRSIISPKSLIKQVRAGQMKLKMKKKKRNPKKTKRKHKKTKRKPKKTKRKKKKTKFRSKKGKKSITDIRSGTNWDRMSKVRENREMRKQERLLKVKGQDLINLPSGTGQSFNPINLNLITHGDRKKSFTPFYNRLKLEYQYTAGEGSYGKVDLYTGGSESEPVSITIKKFNMFPDAIEEAEVIRTLKVIDNGPSVADECSMINARVIYFDEGSLLKSGRIVTPSEEEITEMELTAQKLKGIKSKKYTRRHKKMVENYPKIYVVMDAMDGSLPVPRQLIKWSHDYPVEIYRTLEEAIDLTMKSIQIISKNVKCLSDKGFFYTDIKDGNILYKIFDDENGNGQLKISFGDLGSILDYSRHGRERTWNGVSSYTPPEWFRYLLKEEQYDKALAWSIGSTLIWLLYSAFGARKSRTDVGSPYRNDEHRHIRAILDKFRILLVHDEIRRWRKKSISEHYDYLQNIIKPLGEYFSKIQFIDKENQNKNFSLYDMISNLFCDRKERWTLRDIINLENMTMEIEKTETETETEKPREQRGRW
jgi:hypothetical protein